MDFSKDLTIQNDFNVSTLQANDELRKRIYLTSKQNHKKPKRKDISDFNLVLPKITQKQTRDINMTQQSTSIQQIHSTNIILDHLGLKEVNMSKRLPSPNMTKIRESERFNMSFQSNDNLQLQKSYSRVLSPIDKGQNLALLDQISAIGSVNNQEHSLFETPENIQASFLNSTFNQKIHYVQDNLRMEYTMIEYIQKLILMKDRKKEFTYMNRKSHAYDFYIVEYNQINQEDFITVSYRGVTLTRDGQTEFYTLQEWLSEVSVFERGIKIEFFQNFKLWRGFRCWRTLMRKRKMEVTKATLLKELFILDPYILDGILEIQRYLYDIIQVQNFDQSVKSAVEFKKFVYHQRQFRQSIMLKQLIQLDINILTVTKRILNKFIKSFKIKNRIGLEGQEQKASLVGDTSNKIMPYAINATLKNFLLKMNNFVRCIDFKKMSAKLSMICENIFNLGTKISSFTDEFEKLKYKSTWINVIMTLEQESLQMIPSGQEIETEFKLIIQNTFQSIGSTNQYLIMDPEIQKMLESSINPKDILDHQETIKYNAMFNDNFTFFTIEMKKNISLLHEHMESLEPLKNIYLENLKFDRLENKIDIPYFKEIIQKFQKQDAQLQSLQKGQDIGIFSVSTNEFKETIKNCATNCLKSVYKQIPEILHLQSKAFLEKASDHSQKITFNSKESNSMYVDHLIVYLDNIELAITFEREETYLLADMYNLLNMLKDLKIRVDDSIKIKIQHSEQAIHAIKQKLQLAEAEKENYLLIAYKKLQQQNPIVKDLIKKIQQDLNQDYLIDDTQDIKEVLESINLLEQKYTQLEKQIEKNSKFSKILVFDDFKYNQMHKIQIDINCLKSLWQSKKEYQEFMVIINQQQFLTIQFKKMYEFEQRIKNILAQSIENFQQENEFINNFTQKMLMFKNGYTLIRNLTDPNLQKKEIDQMQDIAQNVMKDAKKFFQNFKDPQYTFEFIINCGILKVQEQVEDVVMFMNKEKELSNTLEKYQKFWNDSKIGITFYKGSVDDFILYDNDDLLAEIDDAIITLNNALMNKYIKNIKKDVEAQIEKFKNFQNLLDIWYDHQRIYLYLEPIITSGISSFGLQKEVSNFKKSQAIWKNIMRRCRDFDLCRFWMEEKTYNYYKDQLEQNIIAFDSVINTLDEYLEKKREGFQRFYFLSNFELLEILSRSKSIQEILPFLKKVFDNIDTLILIDNGTVAEALVSAEKEIFPVKSCFFRTEHAEDQLTTIQEAMYNNIRMAAKKALQEVETESKLEWIKEHITQVTVLVDAQQFAMVIEQNYLIDEENDPDGEDEYGQMDQICMKIMYDIEDLIKYSLQVDCKIQKTKMASLLTQNVYFRDITNDMFQKNILRPSDFQWMRYQKIYFKKDHFTMNMLNAVLNYGYEYLGSFSRLVITPLTERCCLTIITAFQNYLGANPSGPAGTGKTEVCKDLSKIVGRFCVVFNCSESNDMRTIEKLFIGQVITGCWTCLDEFNRIEVEILSVIANKLLTIREAQLSKKHTIEIFSKTITLNPYGSTFITMNPGYVARNELPDNVKSMFRPIAMVLPDYRLVSENLLYSLGFHKAPECAQKLTVLQNVCCQQFSDQDHYDYGMRSLKNIISFAGQLKTENPKLNEILILRNAFLHNTTPKIVENDSFFLQQIIKDVFPNIQEEEPREHPLQSYMKDAYKKLNLAFNKQHQEKIYQLYNLLKIKMGVCIIGHSFSGKSSIINVLQEIINEHKNQNSETGTRINVQKLNPKAVTLNQLYGFHDPMTHTWNDGILPTNVREMIAQDQPNLQSWIILDGPMDTQWIENLNSVLDDSKLMCLPNGERVKLSDSIRLLFEADNMKALSPATISRLGIVYIPEKQLETRQIIEGHFLKYDLKKSLVKLFYDYMQEYLDPVLGYEKKIESPIEISPINLVQKVLFYIDYFLADYDLNQQQTNGNLNNVALGQKSVLLYCLIIGLTSHLNSTGQLFLFHQIIDLPIFSDILNKKEFLRLSYSGYLYFEQKAYGEFISFQEQIESQTHFQKSINDQIIIPTLYSAFYNYQSKIFVQLKKSIQLIGQVGSGKTILMNQAISNLINTIHQKIMITYSIDNEQIIKRMRVPLRVQRAKRKFFLTTQMNETCILLIDDMNFVASDNFGTSQNIELLRQLLDQQGYFDQDDKLFYNIEKVLQFAMCSYYGGGRKKLSTRFTNLYLTFNFEKMDENTIQNIFSEMLSSFFKNNSFTSEFYSYVSLIIKSSLNLMEHCANKFLPSYQSPHYQFSLNDIQKVVQGILLCNPMSVKNKKDLTHLWLHESMRVFHDRLITTANQQTYKDIAKMVATENYELDFEKKTDFYFTAMFNKKIGSSKQLYEYSNDIQKVNVLLDKLTQQEYSKNIHIFKEVSQHVIRISRIMQFVNGHLLLISPQGQGKQTLTQLAAFVTGATMSRIDVNQKLTKKHFRSQLVSAQIKACQKDRKTICFINVQYTESNSFLDDLNSFICTGEMQDMMSRDDLDKVQAQMLLETEKERSYGLFIQRLNKNFHIVLSMSSLGTQLYQRLRLFPFLVTQMQMNWMLEYPKESLVTVTQKVLGKDFQDDTQQSQLTQMTQLCCTVLDVIHKYSKEFLIEDGKQVYITAKNYFDFLDNFLIQKNKMKLLIRSQQGILQTGLDKISEAKITITILKQKIINLKPVLEEKNIEIKGILEVLTRDQKTANIVKKSVEQEVNAVNIQTEKIQILKNESDAILKQAQPIYDSALEQLDKLNRSDLSEIKMNNNPHAMIKFAVECIAVVFELGSDWESCKKNILSDVNLLSKLKNLDCKGFSQKIIDALEKKCKLFFICIYFLVKSNALFIPSEVKNINMAAKSLCEWAHAVNNFNHVYQQILIKRANQNALNNNLKAFKQNVAEKQKELDDQIQKLVGLEKSYQEQKDQKLVLDKEIKDCEDRLFRAGQLTDGLADEEIRWKNQLQEYDKESQLIEGDSFLASAMISFLGPFSTKFRHLISYDWQVNAKQFNFSYSQINILQTKVSNSLEINGWLQHGLSLDDTNVTNAIMIVHAYKFPLVIDPQVQSVSWIQSIQKESFQNAKATEPQSLELFKQCLAFGKVFILQDVDQILPLYLESVLNNQSYMDMNKRMVKIFDIEVEWHENFHLFVITRLHNPHFFPDVFNQLSVINFAINKEGIVDNLLSLSVLQFLPDEEKMRRELGMSIQEEKVQLRQGESKILELLNNSRGNILDDLDLIEQLKVSKEISKAIHEKITQSEKKEAQIMASIEHYHPLANRGAILYIILQNMSKLNCMYKFSYIYFKNLFVDILFSFKQELEYSLQDVINKMTNVLTNMIHSSLFNEDKKLFLIQVAVQFAIEEKKTMTLQEFSLLYEELPKELAFGDKTKNKLMHLKSQNRSYQQLISHIEQNPDQWDPWLTSKQMYKEPMPIKCTPFQKLILIFYMDDQQLIPAIDMFLELELGPEFKNLTPYTLLQMQQMMNHKIPLIIITKLGQDPMYIYNQFLEDAQIPKESQMKISLGSGQIDVAQRLLYKAAEYGFHVVIQNCHLALSFLLVIEKMLVLMDTVSSEIAVSEDFRLFITTQPSAQFSQSVLQASSKLTYEAPQGIKNTMLRNYQQYMETAMPLEKFDIPGKEQLLFAINLFHAVIQERFKFGSIGFSNSYQYNQSDLLQTLFVIDDLLPSFQEIPFSSFRFLIGEAVYGGRITDDWDMRILKSTFGKFCTEKITEHGYKFSKSNDFQTLKDTDLAGQIEYIKTFPDYDPPEIFGLSDRVQIKFQKKQVDDFIQKVQFQLKPPKKQQTFLELKDKMTLLISDTLRYLKPTININKTVIKDDILTQYFQIEVEKFNHLLTYLTQLFNELRKIFSGVQNMSLEMEKISYQLNENIVPDVVKKASYTSEKPFSSWLGDFQERYKFLNNWAQSDIPKSFWISGFFFPQGFLGAIIQDHARQKKIALDRISFHFAINSCVSNEALINPPSNGCYVHGLYSEGFRFEVGVSNKIYMNDKNQNQLYYQTPTLHFSLLEQVQEDQQHVTIPLYRVVSRRGVLNTIGFSDNFVFGLLLQSSQDVVYWSLAGAALFCQLPD